MTPQPTAPEEFTARAQRQMAAESWPTTPEPDWLPQFRAAIGDRLGPEILSESLLQTVIDGASEVAASSLRQMQADLEAARQELGSAMGRLGAQGASLVEKGQQLRARDARIAELVAENADRLAELEANDDRRKDGCWGLPGVTDGHVNAYLRAAREFSGGIRMMSDPEVIRAGLAGVQWVPMAEAPSFPETREVPASHFLPGDTITVTCTAGPQTSWSRGSAPLTVAEDSKTDFVLRNLAAPAAISVSRPVHTLPDKPEAVGTATVAGHGAGIRVMTVMRNGRLLFAGASGTYEPEQISDYQPLLDGQEG